MWIVTYKGRPIGVVEVKKPNSQILNDSRVHGQLFDYMHNLKTYFGLNYCIGILSTYEKWRIFWDSEAQDLSQASILSNEAKHEILQKVDIPLPTSIERDTEKHYPKSPSATISRSLHASKIYNWNDKNLIQVLGTVILKMMRCPSISMPSLIGRSAYIVLQPDRWIWATLPAKALHWNKLPSTKALNFHLLQILGRGEEGLVWLACTSTGSVCALKFAKDKNKSE